MQDHSQATTPRRSMARAMAALTVAAALLGSGCALYKPEVAQGNFVSREQAARLAPGMTREQVRQVLGTPLLQDLFRANRWDYVFTLKERKDVERLNYRLSVFFQDDVLASVEGADTLPTETEFVRVLGHDKEYKPRNLQADPDRLQSFAEKNRPRESSLPEQPTTPGSTSFPPLPQ